MLPYTVNSPRSYKGKSGKMRQSNSWLIFGAAMLLLTGFGGLWYVRSKSAHVTGLLAVIKEHGRQPLQTPLNLTYCHHTVTRISGATNQSVQCESLRQTYAVQAAETKFDQLSAEKDKLDNEVKRLNRAVSMLLTE